MAQTATASVLDTERADFHRLLLRQMLLIRRFEERAGEAYALGKIGGFCHLYIGQEAVAVGAIAALRDDDYVMGSYRDHGHALARGMSAREVMAELYGKVTGCSRGKGGSMHLFSVDRQYLGGHAIVGAHIPLVAGAAFAIRYRGEDRVSLGFFGEAAVNNGAFHEALNMAAVWKLPAIFVAENNRYGMGTAMERASAVYDVATRACSYDMDQEMVDGMDVLAVYEATVRAVNRAREQQLPTLLEARTYRFMGHSMSDPIHGHYRTREEIDEQKTRDPLHTFTDRLVEAGIMSSEDYEEMESQIKNELDDAVAFADESAEPDPYELYTDVYVD
jgi:pyruvate dehydrogenase E1 component alpha subunit